MKCALAHLSIWPLARPLNERRKDLVMMKLPKSQLWAKRMVSFSDAQGKLMLASKVEPSTDSFQTWAVNPKPEDPLLAVK